MTIKLARLNRVFTHEFPHGVTMELLRLKPWEWDGVKASSVRAAAQIREGGAALLKYGFDEDEFSVLENPDSWEGISQFIYAVELANVAIQKVAGIQGEDGEAFEPGDFGCVSWLMRIQTIREEFLRIMDAEGSYYGHEAVTEGNA